MASEQALSERIIKKELDGYHIYSEDGGMHLGGPFSTEEEAKKRLEQIEYFKQKTEQEGSKCLVAPYSTAKMTIKGEKMAILTPEKRFLTLETAEMRVKTSPNGSRQLIGYAAKFDSLSQDLGGFLEKIDKKAFNNALKRSDVRGLKNHDPAMLLGRTKSGTMRLSADDNGLKYEIDLGDTQIARDLVTEIERGDIDGSSFSFTLDDDGDEWDDTSDPPVRTLRNIKDLFDVGPVAYPAYLDTSASVRAFKAHLESRDPAQRERESQLKRLRLLRLKLGQLILERG